MGRYRAKEGYIELWRRLRDHRLWPTFTDRKFTELEAWIDLMYDASYKPHRVTLRGQTFDLKEGELVFSARDRARQWKWKRNEVRSFLDGLCLNGEAIPKDSHGLTHLTIVKKRPYVGWQAAQLPQEVTLGNKGVISTEKPFLNKVQVLVQGLADKLDSTKKRD